MAEGALKLVNKIQRNSGPRFVKVMADGLIDIGHGLRTQPNRFGSTHAVFGLFSALFVALLLAWLVGVLGELAAT